MWSLADLEPNKEPQTVAEELALHFTEVTNQSPPLIPEDIPNSFVLDILIPQVLQENVAKRIRDYKKPNSLVPGDIPKSLINPIASQLSVPLTSVFNTCLAYTKMASGLKKRNSYSYTKINKPQKNTMT